MSEPPFLPHSQPQKAYQPLQLPSALPPASGFTTITTSNQAPTTTKRSRSRPTKSCEQCRRKKLKCNREFPCSQCLKGGRDGRQCHFEHGPEGNDRSSVGDQGMERGLKRFRVDIESAREMSMPSSFVGHGRRPAESPRAIMYPEHRPIASQSRASLSSYTYPTPESVPGPSLPNSAGSERTFPSSTLGRIINKGHSTRYVGNNARMALLSHVGRALEHCSHVIDESSSKM